MIFASKSILALFSVLSLALCANFTMYQYTHGTVSKALAGGQDINGTIIVEGFRAGRAVSVGGVAGLKVDRTIIGFSGKVLKVTQNGRVRTVASSCVEGSWGAKSMYKMEGEINMTLVGEEMKYSGRCTDRDGATIYSFSGSAREAKELPFAQKMARVLARDLVGSRFSAAETVSAATMMNPRFPLARNCSWYLNNFEPAEGGYGTCLLVGLNGQHCAVIDSTGTWFVHTDPKTGVVIRTSSVYARNYFKDGYHGLKCYIKH